jgi:hypothetical protein
VSSFEPDQRADQVESGEIVACGFLVSGCDTPEVLDYVEESLDQIALLIKREVTFPFDLAICFGRDNHLDIAQFKAFDEAVGVISLVTKQRPGLDLSDQRLGLFDVVDLASGKAEHQRIAQGIDDSVDFRRKATARPAYRLVETPFFKAPALC